MQSRRPVDRQVLSHPKPKNLGQAEARNWEAMFNFFNSQNLSKSHSNVLVGLVFGGQITLRQAELLVRNVQRTDLINLLNRINRNREITRKKAFEDLLPNLVRLAEHLESIK